MTNGVSIYLFVLFVLIALSGFFSGSEAALFSLGWLRVRRLKNTARRSYKAANELLRHPTKLITTLLMGNETINGMIGVVGSAMIYDHYAHRVNHELLPLLAVAFVLPFVLIFGDIIPKTLGVKFPERIVPLTAVTLHWFYRIIAPVRDPLTACVDRLIDTVGGGRASKNEVGEEVFRSMVDVGTAEGVLEPQERHLIHNVFRLDDIKVSQIMTSFRHVSFLPKNATFQDALKRFEIDRYSRFPVVDPETGQVAGVLYAKDLLGLENTNTQSRIDQFMRPALGVRDDANALELFAQFRSHRTHFAVVLEHVEHKMVGVATLDDVLSEIFGVIRDERDLEDEVRRK